MNRNGIWYFNYRIPAAVRKRHNIKSRFIRRSLKTSDTRKAVLLSKDYIFMVMGDRNLMDHPELLNELNLKFDQCHVSEHQSNDTVIADDSCSFPL